MEDICKITGYIKKMFRNCPKVSGWYGCFFRREGCASTIKLTGNCTAPLQFDVRYVAEGFWKECDEFYAETIRPVCVTSSSFIKYLTDVKGVGKVTAQKIYDAYGSDTAYVIEFEHERLQTELGLSAKVVGNLYAAITGSSAENQIKKYCPYLPSSVIDQIADMYPMNFYDIFSTKPYSLLYDLEHVRFIDVDRIALQFGVSPSDESRLVECLRFALKEYMDETNDMYLPLTNSLCYQVYWQRYIDGVYKYATSDYAGVVQKYEPVDNQFASDVFVRYVYNAEDDTKLKNDDGRLYLSEIYKEECDLAELISMMNESDSLCNVSDDEIGDYISDYEDMTGKTLDNEQRQAVVAAVTNRLSIVTGGPGRGKTDTVACIIYVWKRINPSKKPVLCAPTGMAVRKLKDAVGGDVMTVMYRILKDRYVESLRGKNFILYEKEKAKKTDNLVIIDETSMLDWFSAYHIMRVYRNCQIVFVGDVNQLPPIGKGQFFKDICRCEHVAKTVLLTNHRSDIQSVSDNADMVNAGTVSSNFMYDDNFVFDRYQTDDYAGRLLSVYLSCVSDDDGEVDWELVKDTCLMAPTRYGDTGVVNLNMLIQSFLNPAFSTDVSYRFIDTETKGMPVKSAVYHSTYIRVGDRVMITKNKKDDDGTLLFYNGECGIVTSYSLDEFGQEELGFLSDDGEEKILYNKDIKSLVLGYAVTVHKSQGSEYRNVIFSVQSMLLRLDSSFTCRNLLYTAITRAKKKVWLVGNQYALDKCIINEQPFRHTGLLERIS